MRTALVVAAGVIVAWGVLGALFLPGYFRGQLERFVSEHTRGSLSIGRLAVNPFILATGIHDFVLLGPERDTLLSAREFTLDVSITSIVRKGIVLDRIALVGPEVHLTVLPDGRLDWMRLFLPERDTARVATRPAQFPSLRIRRVSLEGGRLLFQDQSRSLPFATAIEPIQLELERFSTLPTERGDHSFTASLIEGGTLRWQGAFSVDPVVATGRVDVDSLSARALWRWMSSDLRFEVLEGRLSLTVPYTYRASGDSTNLVLRQASIRANGVRIVEPGRAGDVVVVPSLAAEGGRVDFARLKASLSRVHAEGARLVTSLSPDTVFSLARLFEPRTRAEPAKAGPPPPWRVTLDRFDVSNVAVSFTDSTQWPPPTLSFDQMGFETRGLDSGRELSGAIRARARVEESGTLEAEGHASLFPTFVDLGVRAQAVPLRPVQAYLDTFIRLDIVRGNADLVGRLKAGATQDGRLTFSLRADGRVRELAAADSASGDDFLRVAEAVVKGAELDLGPDRFRMKSLALARPSATVALGSDASLNLFRIFPSLVPPAKGTVTKAVPFRIDRIGIKNGRMRFVDHTVAPPYVTRVERISGELLGLSSDPKDEAHFVLAGKADGTAPIKVDARLRPADKEPYGVFTFSLSSYEMTALTPYIGKYLGRFVDRGQMSLDLDYRIADRHLKGQNDAKLDQFTLGQKSGSKDATRLPVGLALALLRDRHGRIALDVPVEGDLDDPHFGIGRVILQALVNLVTRLAMSPFALLGKLVPGGGDETLGVIAFAPGVDTLSADQATKVGKLVEALGERPELRIYVTGAADSIVDRGGLARSGLETQIARQRRSEFFAAGVAEPERAVDAPIPPGERERAIAKLYLRAFGKDSLGKTLPHPECSSGDLRRIAKLALSGRTPDRPTWPSSRRSLTEDAVRTMESRLLAGTVIAPADLERLAVGRAEALKRQLVEVRGLSEERVFIKGAAVGNHSAHEQVACQLDLTD
ncbi:MAG TPA: DUF748 domain-containing protein [Candidatus Eisenbacteria bacterium]|nr:DUF748 domain-containing protein [Candidatus Eisenbacteria bacterium]